MALQETVRAVQTTGLAGEIAREGPTRALPWILNSDGTPNVIGYAYTKESDRNAIVGGDAGIFVGILARPKEHALVGVGTSSLTASNVLADGVVGTFVTMGHIYIQLDATSDQSAAGTVGTGLFYVDATGIISAGTAGTGETQIPNAVIDIEDVAEDGLAIVKLTN